MTVLLKLRSITIAWPDTEERGLIAQIIQQKYGFVNCVGLTDGTLLPLESKPFLNGEDYYTRKGGYALNAMITCDDAARIRDLICGWPGPSHDNRVWLNGKVNLHREDHFLPNEYLLGDSAFVPSPIMIPAFKKPPHADLDVHKPYFNNKLAKALITSEHCIGLLKARFQYLKRARISITSKRDLQRLLRRVECACILHNLFTAEPISPSWEEEMRANPLSEDDELNAPVPTDAAGEASRTQLFATC